MHSENSCSASNRTFQREFHILCLNGKKRRAISVFVATSVRVAGSHCESNRERTQRNVYAMISQSLVSFLLLLNATINTVHFRNNGEICVFYMPA